MNSEKFEREILKLAFETDIRITVATVAYYFGIPSRDARTKLDELIDAGLLELDSDRDGNLFYKLHQEAGSKAAGQIEELIAPTAGKPEPMQNRESESGSKRRSLNETVSYSASHAASQSVEGADSHGVRGGAGGYAGEPYGGGHGAASPVGQGRPVGDGSAPRTSTVSDTRQYATSGGVQDTYESHVRYDQASNRSWEAPQYRRASTSVSGYRPDATATRCGISPFVVAEDASCDGLTPNVQYQSSGASCDEPLHGFNRQDPRTAGHNDQRGPVPVDSYRRRTHDTLITYEPNQQELVDQDRVHHPAIAVILSICLPGAGQFYNGQIEKGVFMMLMTFLSWMAFFGWAFQLWSIFDALIVASRIRSAQESEKNGELQANEQRRAIPHRRY